MIKEILNVYLKSKQELVEERQKEGTTITKTVTTEHYYPIDKDYRDILVKEMLKHNNIKF